MILIYNRNHILKMFYEEKLNLSSTKRLRFLLTFLLTIIDSSESFKNFYKTIKYLYKVLSKNFKQEFYNLSIIN